MAIIEDLVDLVQGMAADTASPFPGFFTITTIAGILLARGSLHEKIEKEASSRGTPSRRQLLYLKNLVLQRPDLFEIKREGGRTYFRLK